MLPGPLGSWTAREGQQDPAHLPLHAEGWGGGDHPCKGDQLVLSELQTGALGGGQVDPGTALLDGPVWPFGPAEAQRSEQGAAGEMGSEPRRPRVHGGPGPRPGSR